MSQYLRIESEGESMVCTFEDFMAANQDGLCAEDCDAIAGLKIGESLTLGGGAFATATITNLGDPEAARFNSTEFLLECYDALERAGSYR